MNEKTVLLVTGIPSQQFSAPETCAKVTERAAGVDLYRIHSHFHALNEWLSSSR